MIWEIKKIIDNDNIHTCCLICKKNCHSPCDCFLRSLTRCYIFTVFGKVCEKCGHLKKDHSQGKDKYVKEYIKKESPTIKKQIEMLKNFLINQRNIEHSKNEEILSQTRLRLRELEDERTNTEKEISTINDDIKCNVICLKLLSERINEIAMNNNAYKTIDEYFGYLIDMLSVQEDPSKNRAEIESLKTMKNSVIIILNIINERWESLKNLEESDFNERIKEIIRTNKLS